MTSSRTLRRAIDALVLAGTVAVVATVLPPRLWLAGVAATGGDTASHFPTAQMVSERLLPEGRLLGWMPDNYAGFPLFQPYFPAPFLVMAALSPVLGLERSFNLVTVAGTFLLPLAAYLCFRWLRFSFPVPALAATATLPFLLDESSSLWGGNLLSTLAGEFAYSLSLPLLLLFVGCAWRDLDSTGRAGRAGLLLALVGLTHGYAFLFGATVALALPWTQREWWRGFWFLARLYSVAVGLLAFWLVPALLFAEFGTPYRDQWPVSWQAAVPLRFLPWLLAAAASGLWRKLRKRGLPPDPGALSPAALLWWGIPAALLLYELAGPLGVVDIRFLPFAQLMALLLSAPALGALARRLRAGALIPVAVLLAAFLWIDPAAGVAPRWARWNYSGFESKAGWPAFSRLQQRLAGTLDDPRVAWEHSSLHNAVGTIRAFESTPRFSGRATLEGVYNQSSGSAPFVFFLQSEISREQSCPFPDYHCSGLNPEAAAEHLELFNAPQVVVRSSEVAAAFDRSSSYQLDQIEPPYRLYRLKGSRSGYVVPLDLRPLFARQLDSAPSWRLATYLWFQKPGAARVPLIRPDGSAVPGFALQVDALPDEVPAAPLPGADGVAVETRLSDQAISIRTSKPGHPLLVKVSYHPRWRASDGSPIYQVSPNFMLVVPRSPSLELRFGSPPLVRAGTLASMFTLAALLVGTGLERSDRGRALLQRFRSRLPSSPGLRPSGALGALLVVAAVGSLVLTAPLDARVEMRRAQASLTASGCGAAEPRFERVVAISPASYPALMAHLELARCAAQAGRWPEAVERYRRFVADHPTHPERPGASFELGRALLAGGDPEAARRIWRDLADDYPDTVAAVQARDQLAAAGE